MTEGDIARAKIGDRVKYVPPEYEAEHAEGTITHKLGKHYEVTWDDGEVYSYSADPASCVFLK